MRRPKQHPSEARVRWHRESCVTIREALSSGNRTKMLKAARQQRVTFSKRGGATVLVTARDPHEFEESDRPFPSRVLAPFDTGSKARNQPVFVRPLTATAPAECMLKPRGTVCVSGGYHSWSAGLACADLGAEPACGGNACAAGNPG